MRWLLLALCGCNRLFGNDPAVVIDAQQFDAPFDARPTCMLGTVPTFSPELHPAFDQRCTGYSIAADTQRAMAHCFDNLDGGLYEGPVDHALTLVSELPLDGENSELSAPRLAPEGDFLMFSSFDLTAALSTYRTYTRGMTTWERGPDADLPQYGDISVSSRGPDRRLIWYGSEPKGFEYAQNAASGAWTVVREVDLGTVVISHGVWLSPDALRMIVFEAGGAVAPSTLHYADRSSRDVPFGALQVVSTIPTSGDVFVTEDCGRVYMSGVQEVFYALGK